MRFKHCTGEYSTTKYYKHLNMKEIPKDYDFSVSTTQYRMGCLDFTMDEVRKRERKKVIYYCIFVMKMLKLFSSYF